MNGTDFNNAMLKRVMPTEFTNKQPDTIVGTIASLKRSTISRTGNPSWIVTLDSTGEGVDWRPGAVFRTQTNSSVGYSIDNAEYRDVPVKFTLSRAGRIIDIEVA